MNIALEIDRTDLATALAALADRLRIQAAAIRGMAAETGEDFGSFEVRRSRALAAELDGEAKRLERLSAALCGACRMRKVTETFSVTDEKKADKRGRAARKER